MENSWSWQTQCGSLCPSSSSSQDPPLPPHNQILNGSFHLDSSVRAKPTSTIHTLAPAAVNPWTSNSSSCSLDHTELGSSFLSLLSVPPCDIRNEVPIRRSNAGGSAAGNAISHISSGLLAQNRDSQRAEAVVNLGWVVSPMDRVSESCGVNDVFQGNYPSLQKLELPTAGIHRKLYHNENQKNSPSLKVSYVNDATSCNVWKTNAGDTLGVSQKVPSSIDSSVSCLTSNLLTGCPKVFCLGLSGHLLLSNTGLLGVLCSCHGLHMSIAKFSEHSGLSNSNPGDAVHFDSGESVSQWRRSYFHKFGIRTPEDHFGWDWPPGLSVTAGSPEHGWTHPSMFVKPNQGNQGSSVEASVQFMDPWSLTLCPKNSQSDQKVVDEFVNFEKQQSAKDCSSLFPKGPSSSSKNILHFVADEPMMGHSRSGCPTFPNHLDVRGPYNVRPAISSYEDQIYTSGDSVLPPCLPNLKTLGKDIAIGRSVGSLVDTYTGSSNFELRLGQPSQQGQTSVRSFMPASGSHRIASHCRLQESMALDQHVHKSSSGSIKGCRQQNYLPGIISTSSTRTEQNQLENVNHAVGVYSVPNAFKIKHLKGDAFWGSVTSESFGNLKSPFEENNHFKSINDATNDSHMTFAKPHSECSPPKCGEFGFPLLRGRAIGTEFGTNVLGSQKLKQVDKVVHNIDCLHSTAKINTGSCTKSKEGMWSFSGVVGDSDGMNYPVFHDKGPNMFHLADEPITRNTLNYTGQVCYPDHSGKAKSKVLRTISSPMDFGNILSSQAASVGISATNLNSMKNLTPLWNKDNITVCPYLFDENVKMTAFHPMSVFSHQKIGAGTSKTIPVPEGYRNFSGKQQIIVPSSVSDTQKNRFDLTNAPNTSEVARHALLSANLTFTDTETLPSVTDTEKWCNFWGPAISNGRYYHGKDTEAQCQLNSNQQPTRQFFLRLHGDQNSTPSNEVRNCHQELPCGYFPSKFSCSSNLNCSAGRHDLNPSLRNFREPEGNAVDLVEPLLGPKLVENCTHIDKDNAFGANRTIVQNMKKVDCNSSQWRDVPRKVVNDATSRKCFQEGNALKEHEMSNMSSGCSAPAVTQVSIDVNNKDSSTVDGMDTDNFVMDEGSGIERCLSSDDDSERSSEFCGLASKVNLVNRRSSKTSFSKSSHSRIHELGFTDSLKVRKLQNHAKTSFAVQAKGDLQKYDRDFGKGKRRRVKWRRLYPSVPAPSLSTALNGASKSAGDAGLCSGTLKNIQMLPQDDKPCFTCCPCSLGQNLKQKRSAYSSFDTISRKKKLRWIHHIEVEETDSETNLNAKTDCSRASKAVGRKRLRSVGATQMEQDDMHDSACFASEITAKITASDCTKTNKPVNISHSRRRPVVCGKYGIISNGNSSKSAKIVSLRKVLKAARRCHFAESQKVNSISVKESEKARCDADKERNNEARMAVSVQMKSQHLMEGKETEYSVGSKDSYDLSHIMKKRRHDGNRSHAILESNQSTQIRRKSKEVRKRSVYELTIKENDFSCVKSCITKDGRSSQRRKSRFVSKLAENAGNDRMFVGGIHNVNKYAKMEECQTSRVLDVFCCVCGSSNKDKNNCLLECGCCLIKVHQACYGVSKVPKAQWCCRPCKTNCKNIVCVLCGYGGGAMTRALCSRNIVKSLLKAWSIGTESNLENTSFSKSLESPFHRLSSTKSVHESDPFLIIRPAEIGSTSLAKGSTDLSEHVDTVDISSAITPAICNSITAGILDSTVKQWVHMVCGLWTPGTRCPNVDTMSAFDVSGAYRPKQDVVCSICQRSGGSCIQCRVANCHVQFHPWCAHQKGLLQSEVEGIDNQSVGFYGRCMLHAMYQQFNSDSYHTSSANHGERESTCARTEGFKGRKWDGFHHNLPYHSDGSSGCLVPQEQLNAWIHINGQKTCISGPLKLPNSVIEYDCRKEYARFKQSRGWKHLVVYKSGIHGLGLYTSRFIFRGAMVVEYVGEIVGLHVADKRETEYQAGKNVQYKSACYFFRIDKEHIIDATRKGGIARFVNHSCLPNCVAKVISVRNEKKVVFFAERDIYPGEEVTYDYHFNYEDEGKKIPCYCNSKNCRRYLN
ncbi:uncharacterized protein [Coffea arabica]|uniref:Uncharacterized protein isoform X1 n=1 Tax=Coffea arabica TaxID=13443 RepID=A0A6P6U4C5_COFAR